MSSYNLRLNIKSGKYKGYYIIVHELEKDLINILKKGGWILLDRKKHLIFYKENFMYRDTWKTFYQIWKLPESKNPKADEEKWIKYNDELNKLRK